MSSFLLINQYYWPDEAATAQLLADLAEDLASAGHRVTALCGRSRYACRETLHAGVFEHRGVRIERVGGSDWGRDRLAGRMFDMVSFMRAAKKRLKQIPKHDAVIAMSSPPLIGELGVDFHRRRRVPLMIWAQDLYPEIAERLGRLKNPLLREWVRRRTRQIYKAVSKVVVPGERMREALSAYSSLSGKVTVIPNWADLDQIQAGPVSENRFRKEQGWGRERVIMYSGNLGAAHDGETMLTLLALLQSELPTLRIVLVGNSLAYREFYRRSQEMNLQRVSSFPPQPRERLGEILGAADAHLIAQKAETEGLLVPSKFYGVAAAGRPVIFIGPRTSEVGRAVVESRLGVVVAPGEASTGMRPAFRALHMAQDESWVVPYIRDWAETNASRRARTRQFQGVLEEVAAC